MLEALVRNWRWLMFRAMLTAIYGVIALAWPDFTFIGFVYLFGLYAVLDGIVALAIAIDVQSFRGFGSLLVESLVRIGGGLVAMGEPGVIVRFPRFLAGWALLTAIAEGLVAIVLRRELSGEWPLPFAGAVSAIVALLLLLMPLEVGVLPLKWLIGPYAIIFGVTLVSFARRLHQLARELPAA
jgi:uncharacterized membrane protein HdeD (DUF308 family)